MRGDDGATHGTCRRTYQHILTGLVCYGVNEALHPIQGLVTPERLSTETVHLVDLDKFLPSRQHTNFCGRDRVFFEFLCSE